MVIFRYVTFVIFLPMAFPQHSLTTRLTLVIPPYYTANVFPIYRRGSQFPSFRWWSTYNQNIVCYITFLVNCNCVWLQIGFVPKINYAESTPTKRRPIIRMDLLPGWIDGWLLACPLSSQLWVVVWCPIARCSVVINDLLPYLSILTLWLNEILSHLMATLQCPPSSPSGDLTPA